MLDGDPSTLLSARWIDVALLSLIVANVIAVVLGTVPSVQQAAGIWLDRFELVSVSVFSIEYGLRLWSAPGRPEYADPFWGRLRYAVTPLALADLAAILPFYVTVGSADLRIIRVFRVLRLLRLAKPGRYLSAFRLIGSVFYEKRGELAAVAMSLIIVLLVASSLLYFIEQNAQPVAARSAATFRRSKRALASQGADR
jgi:voltage-gated potassium channel